MLGAVGEFEAAVEGRLIANLPRLDLPRSQALSSGSSIIAWASTAKKKTWLSMEK